jgi:quercetin dioxygenase-like cupin family protein
MAGGYTKTIMSLKIVLPNQIEAGPVSADGAANCRMRCLIGPNDAAPSFSMREFEIGIGGHTPQHSHAHEHEVYILQGEGVVFDGRQEHVLRPGVAVLVQPNQPHQFRNTGAGALKFLCLIPHPLRGMRGTCVAACGCDG